MRDKLIGLIFSVLPILAWLFPGPDSGFDLALVPLAAAGIAGGIATAGTLFGRRKRANLPFDPALTRSIERQLYNRLTEANRRGGFFTDAENRQLMSADLEAAEGFFRPTEQRAADTINAQGLTGTSAANKLFLDLARIRRGASAEIGGFHSRRKIQERLRLLDEMSRFLGRTPTIAAAEIDDARRRPETAALFANLFAGSYSPLMKK